MRSRLPIARVDTALMRAFRSPSHVPALALAGAAFAVVAVSFATAGGLVSFHFRSAGPPPAEQSALVLPASRPAPAGPARVAPTSPAVPARPAPPSRAAPTVRSPPDSPPPAAVSPPPTVVPAPGVARPQPQPQPPAQPPPPPPPVRAPQRSNALRPVGDLVDKTTTGLARVLRATTRALAKGTEGISPALATTLTQAGELLGDTVEGIGQALGVLLGSPPNTAPGTGAPTPP
jgi:outer membrane biosynthesis protein TonB